MNLIIQLKYQFNRTYNFDIVDFTVYQVEPAQIVTVSNIYFHRNVVLSKPEKYFNQFDSTVQSWLEKEIFDMT